MKVGWLSCVVSLALLSVLYVPVAHGFGDRLLRTYFLFMEQPLTMRDAISQGWTNMSSGCDKRFGYQFANPDGIYSTSPTMLYYTAAGQLSGFGVRVWGKVPDTLLESGLWYPTNDPNAFDIFITTRSPSLFCSGETDEKQVLGDRLNINGHFPIPLNMTAAQATGWVEGNCIYQMGIHHAYDVRYPGRQSWDATSLVPVLPMYEPSTKKINAILFNVWVYQWTEPIGVFEGPFTSSLFCNNWCADSGCKFDQVTVWSTLHWHFVDPTQISCTAARCQL